ncbi:unnamed protein product [Caenorhabditis brenneri]
MDLFSCWLKPQPSRLSDYAFNPTFSYSRSEDENVRTPRTPPSIPYYETYSDPPIAPPRRRRKQLLANPAYTQREVLVDDYRTAPVLTENKPPKKSFQERLNEVSSNSDDINLEEFSAKLMMDHVKDTNQETEKFKRELHEERLKEDLLMRETQKKMEILNSESIEAYQQKKDLMNKKIEEIYRSYFEEKDEYNRRKEQEFQESTRIQKQEQDEILERIREQKRASQEESDRIHQQGLLRMRKYFQTLQQCLIMKQNFEIQEEKLANWLKVITDSIARAKYECSIFESDCGSLRYHGGGENEPNHESILSLHRFTLSAYDTCYDGWLEMKRLSESFPDRIFIFILKNCLAKVCNKLFHALEAIDQFLEDNSSLERISETFSKINTYDVLSTSELRERSTSANWEDIREKNPLVYRKASAVAIEELQEVSQAAGTRV